MEELLASTGYQIKSLKKGEKVKAKLIRITERSAYFDIGGKSEGVVNETNFSEARTLIDTLAIGDEISAVVIEPESRDGVVLLSLRGAAQDEFWKKMQKAYDDAETVEVSVRAVNPHGIVAAIENETAFIPSSQVGEEASKKGEELVGTRLKAKIIDLDKENARIVLSEKAVSEAKELEKVKKALDKVKEGDKFEGVVTTVTNFGAFVEVAVDVDGKKIPVEGLVHVSELSWAKVGRPEDEVAVGDKVPVQVLAVDKNKLSLSIKHATADPWKNISEKYKKDDEVSGQVVRVSDFGVFVELEPGVEGLIHITKVPPGTSLKSGQKVNCYIEEIDTKEQKISLGLITTSKPVGYR